MPFYDLRCVKCDEDFNVMASMAEKMEKRIPCPKCGSMNMETVYKSAPYYIKSSSGASPPCPNSKVCGTACPHSRSA